MDTLGIEPRALRMRSGCDTTTPCALEMMKQNSRVFCRITYAAQPNKCRDPGSNRGPSDLQSDALPTELSRLGFATRIEKITKRY